MDVFPNEIHLSSWAGMSLGNNENAGKKKPGSTTYGNKFLKTMLTEFGWVAFKTERAYQNSKYKNMWTSTGNR